MTETPPVLIAPSRAAELEATAKTIGALINPIAQQQAEVQKAQISANLERDKLAIQARRQDSREGFYIAAGSLTILGGAIVGLLIAGQYELIKAVLIFVGGALTGYGTSRIKRS